MNAYQKSIELGLTGEPQHIVDQLKLTGLTVKPINLDDLLFTLNNRGMLIRLIRPADTGEKWSGTVVNMVLWLNANGSPDQAAAVNQWFSHITNDRNNLFDTTQPAFARSFWSLAQTFGGQPGFPSADDFKAVADLGGGWLFADLTVEQFNASKTEYENAVSARQALQAIQARRQHWDGIAAGIRSRIESGELVDNAAVLAAVQAALS